MELVEEAHLFPGSCALCRGAGAPFVDTLAFLISEERVYLCHMCAGEVADTIGAVRGDELTELRLSRQELEELTVRHEAALEELARLKDAVQTTLARGAVREGEGFKLRPKPGDKAVKV